MQADFLQARRLELTALSEERGVDWRQTVRSADQDDEVLFISVLATLLELDVSKVFNPQTSLEEVERDSRQLLESHDRVEFEHQRAEIERLARNMPDETKVKLAEQLEAIAAALRKG
jgi:hypothetical protein